MTDKKFKVGETVRVTTKFDSSWRLSWEPEMDEYIGKTGKITCIDEDDDVLLDGKWFFYPRVLEHVKKPQAARILTEKVTIEGVPCRKILGFEGILSRDELPGKYLKGTPRFVFCPNTLNHVQLWDGERFVSGASMAEPGHVDLDVPGGVWIKGTCNIMFKGDMWPEHHFREYLTWLKRAGSRLAKIRKQEKAAWSGKETFEI